MDPIPDLAEVTRIATLANPIVRNLEITHSYHLLSRALAARTGQVANWCTFATWASRQAGDTIRSQGLAQRLRDVLMTRPAAKQAAAEVAAAAQQMGAGLDHTRLLAIVWEALDPAAAIERASDAVARGNQKVYAEIGHEFTRFAAACLRDEAFEPGHLDEFCATLRAGEPPEGQQYLGQAFRRYYQALFEPNAKTRAELLFWANAEIGFHEQTRLQPEIAEALEAGLVSPLEFARRLITAIFPARSWAVYGLVLLRRALGRPTLLELVIERLIAVVRQQLRALITEHMLALALPPNVRLRLGDDLRLPFAPDLQEIASQELGAFLARVDPTPNSLSQSGALDWANLPDRVHFIVDLFRCYAATPALLEPPFTASQVAEFKAGRVPEGPL